MQFEQAEHKFKLLKAQFRAGALSELEFKARLEELMVQDEQGDWWMIGYESERWHRHDGTDWVQAEPAGGLSQLSMPTISSASRRPGLLLPAATILVFLALAISGYYMFNNMGRETEQGPIPTEENIFPVPDIPVTGATHTPQPTARASKTPSSTATPKAEFQVFIAVNKATLYKGPSLQYDLAVQNPYSRGEPFTVTARDPSGLWLLSTALDGNEGWLYVDWIDFDFDPLLIATAESIPSLPPTPTRKPKDSEPEPKCGVIC